VPFDGNCEIGAALETDHAQAFAYVIMGPPALRERCETEAFPFDAFNITNEGYKASPERCKNYVVVSPRGLPYSKNHQSVA